MPWLPSFYGKLILVKQGPLLHFFSNFLSLLYLYILSNDILIHYFLSSQKIALELLFELY